MKKIVSLLLLVSVMSTFFSGCGTDKKNTNNNVVDFAVNEEANKVQDSSDLPDWEGKKIKLKTYYALGMSMGRASRVSKDDVVSKEIERVTGVSYDAETSFENNDELMDAKIGKLMAANDLPDIIINPERSVLEKMIQAGMVYDLTELYPKYCTNLVSQYNKAGLERGNQSEREDGKMYYFYYSPYNWAVKYVEPELSKDVISRKIAMPEPYPYVYVRDDILKMVYPQAKTTDELREMYMQNGTFTEEEICDVTFNSKEEFFGFLQKVKDLNIKVGNKTVSPTYPKVLGGDNWNLYTNMGGIWGYNPNSNGNGSVDGVNYFTYWDNEAKKVDYTFKQPFFKEAAKDMYQLVRDGLASKNSLVENGTQFRENLNNGLYAVVYGWDAIDNNIYEANGMNFKYRKVYLKIPQNYDKFVYSEPKPVQYYVAILNKNIAEEDLPQILRFFDFMASDAGQKLSYWGPRSAGLFEEKDGKRVFIDKELEECMVYGVDNKKDQYYNLRSSAWPGYPMFDSSKYDPVYMYDVARREADVDKYFTLSRFEAPKLVQTVAPNIWEFESFGVKNVQKFWNARSTFEEAVEKIFVAKNDEEFEEFYNNMVNTATTFGLDDATLEEINKAYRENINKANMDKIE